MKKHIPTDPGARYGRKNKVARYSTSFRPSQVRILEDISSEKELYVAILVRFCFDYTLSQLGKDGMLRELDFYRDDAK